MSGSTDNDFPVPLKMDDRIEVFSLLTELIMLFSQLEQLLKENFSFSDLLDIGKDLRNVLDPNVDKIYAGDIHASINIMNTLTQEASRMMHPNIAKEDLACFLEVRGLIR